VLAALAAALWIAPAARTQSEKHLTIYAPAALYSVPVTSYDGKDYIGLADVLEPLGSVEAREDGKKWKLRFTPSGGHEVNAEFQDGKNKGKVRGQDVQLSGNFHMENGRGYVPLHVIGNLLPWFEGSVAEFHENSLRLLLGNVAVKFSQQMQKGAAPKLVLSFSAPVNPMVATEPGKLRLIFRREALVGSTAETVQTGDPTIISTTFSDSPGVPQITVNGSVALSAAFADGGKTIIITPVPAVTTPAESAKSAPALTSPPIPTPPANPTPPAASAPAAPRFLVVIDPAHGGDERGAAITDTIKEKDVNLALARRLQHELQNKGINAVLLRTADTTLGLDERAIAANSAHPALYICVHSANLGTGMRIFTALMSPAGVTAHKFLPWPQAQAPYLDLSSQFAGSISAELSNRQVPVTALPAPLRPMRNIAAPAIAIEIAPPDDDADNIGNADYQQNIAAAIANGIAAMKPKLQGAR
jgi:N-acetylmuramoyl-L-alanine amidase